MKFPHAGDCLTGDAGLRVVLDPPRRDLNADLTLIVYCPECDFTATASRAVVFRGRDEAFTGTELAALTQRLPDLHKAP